MKDPGRERLAIPAAAAPQTTPSPHVWAQPKKTHPTQELWKITWLFQAIRVGWFVLQQQITDTSDKGVVAVARFWWNSPPRVNTLLSVSCQEAFDWSHHASAERSIPLYGMPSFKGRHWIDCWAQHCLKSYGSQHDNELAKSACQCFKYHKAQQALWRLVVFLSPISSWAS